MPAIKGLFGDFGFSDADFKQTILAEAEFNKLLYKERQRLERSGSPFVMALIDLTSIAELSERNMVVRVFLEHLTVLVRAADVCGWLKEFEKLACIFVDICGRDAEHTTTQSVELRIRGCMKMWLPSSIYQKLGISIHAFPERQELASSFAGS